MDRMDGSGRQCRRQGETRSIYNSCIFINNRVRHGDSKSSLHLMLGPGSMDTAS